MEPLTETYKREISCVLSCFDRLILNGTIPEISYSQGMTRYMYENGIKIFDYPKFAEPFKETIRANNFFSSEDLIVLTAIVRGEFNINGNACKNYLALMVVK